MPWTSAFSATRPSSSPTATRRVLIDPFLAPNNPKAPVSADDVEPDPHPAHPRARRPPRRRGRGREAHRRPLRRAGRDRQLARQAGRRERLRPEPRRHGRVRLGLGEAGAGLPQLDDARRHGHLRERPGDQHRRHDRLPPRRHLPVRRPAADRASARRSTSRSIPIGGHYTMDRHDAVVAAELIGAGTVIPCHYNTFPPIETDAAGVQVRRRVARPARRWSCWSRARRHSV